MPVFKLTGVLVQVPLIMGSSGITSIKNYFFWYLYALNPSTAIGSL